MSSSLSTIATPLTSLLRRLQHILSKSTTNTMHYILSTLLSLLLSWRTWCLILALTNLKSLPLSWHIRLFRLMGKHGAYPSDIHARLQAAAQSLPSPSTISPSNPKPVHPVFRPLSIHTRAPVGECDYNLHKSNSTYFSDLDLSRGSLMAQLIGPALRLNALVPHGIRKGLCYPILGSVHTSFLREIKPYEAYDVRSRVLGWDRKWIVIGSWFVRKAHPHELRKDQESGKTFLKGPVGKEEVVFACVLNKYVIKAGRITVPPELCFSGSGWFPVRPEATATIRAYAAAAAANKKAPSPTNNTTSDIPSGAGTGTATPLGPEKAVDDAANAVQNVALQASRRLSMSKKHDEESKTSSTDELVGWTWEEIEEERLRGLKIAEHWLNLDVELRKEYEEDMVRQIW